MHGYHVDGQMLSRTGRFCNTLSTVDGIVDIDYACPYFLPKWVNEVHKWGLYYLGEPRREHLSYPFHRLLFSEDQEQVNQMWRTYVRHRDEINATGSTLRRAIGSQETFLKITTGKLVELSSSRVS
jgi:hypothetical protein